MSPEILVEEGIVITASNGFAEVALNKTENCEECSAKIICKPRDQQTNLLRVSDPLGASPGDFVRIEFEGKSLLKTSFLLYGLPLLLLLTGIFSGTQLFAGMHYSELYSFLLGAGLMALYYLLKFVRSGDKPLIVPKIVYVKKIAGKEGMQT